MDANEVATIRPTSSYLPVLTSLDERFAAKWLDIEFSSVPDLRQCMNPEQQRDLQNFGMILLYEIFQPEVICFVYLYRW